MALTLLVLVPLNVTPIMKKNLLKYSFIIAIFTYVFSRVMSNSTSLSSSSSELRVNGYIHNPEFVTNDKTINVDRLTLPKKEIKLDCNELVSTKKRAWALKNYEGWDSYIDKGYSLDDVTLAVEFFLNKNFATSFRINTLRKNSEHHLESLRITDKVKAIFPEIFTPNFKIEKRIPNQDLLELSSVSTDEELRDLTVTVDDIAYFLHHPNSAPTDILMLIDYVEDVNSTVSYNNIDSISLLDHAVVHSQFLAVKKLLELGMEPQRDGYLGSTMEWALSALTYDYYKENQEEATKIISLLDSYGATARYKVQNSNMIKGSFPKNYYQFDRTQIEFLQVHYNLDLTALRNNEHESLSPNPKLIEELITQRNEFLSSVFPQVNGENSDFCREK